MTKTFVYLIFFAYLCTVLIFDLMAYVLKGFMQYCCRDLMNAYSAAWQQPDVNSHEEAIRKAITSPASRFWISPDEAARKISLLEHGKEVKRKEGSNKYAALMALYDVYKRLRKHRFKTESIAFVTAFACLEPAPRFFISYDRARRIIDKINKGVYVFA